MNASPHLWTAVLVASMAAGVAGQEGASRKGDTPDAPIPELPPEELPPRTGVKPDPARDRYERDTVHVAIEERVHPRELPAYTPPMSIVERHVAEYFRRAGFRVVDEEAGAKHVVRGRFEAVFGDVLVFRGRLFALKFEASAQVTVVDAEGELEGDVIVPAFEREGAVARPAHRSELIGPPSPFRKPSAVREEDLVVADLRRETARIIWHRLSREVEAFSDPRIPALIDSLTVEDLESNELPTTADDVIRKLAALRFDAVPYLLEALADERPVLVPATYPGLTELNADKLRVYHIADKALEEIFQKVSRMGLDTPAEHRFIIIRGWENEWRRFCPPFRDSPHAPRRKKTG